MLLTTARDCESGFIRQIRKNENDCKEIPVIWLPDNKIRTAINSRFWNVPKNKCVVCFLVGWRGSSLEVGIRKARYCYAQAFNRGFTPVWTTYCTISFKLLL